MLDVEGQQHTVWCYYKLFVQIINFNVLFCNALKCQILVPAEYWHPYYTCFLIVKEFLIICIHQKRNFLHLEILSFPVRYCQEPLHVHCTLNQIQSFFFFSLFFGRTFSSLCCSWRKVILYGGFFYFPLVNAFKCIQLLRHGNIHDVSLQVSKCLSINSSSDKPCDSFTSHELILSPICTLQSVDKLGFAYSTIRL